MSGITKARGVLVDIDGTLLDSNDAHARAWVAALRDHGREVPFERVRPLIGMGGDKVTPELTGFEEEDERAKPFLDAKREHFGRLLPGLRPCRGARALLERLQAEGLVVVIATSAGGEESGKLLAQAGVRDLVDDETSRADVESSKPDPDVIQAALRKGGLAPEEAVMIGDTPYDVEAAARAGVPALALRCGGWWDDRALHGAAAIYDDPAALLAGYLQSPIVRGR